MILDTPDVPEAPDMSAENQTAAGPPPCLTVRRPDEILAMAFDDSDRILGDRLLALGQAFVILGPGGIGKSRLLLQLAAALRAGLQFLGLETHCPALRWLILQAENSNRRLRNDLAALRQWVGPKAWSGVNDGLIIHTLENDADGFLSLNNRDTQARIEGLIREVEPDIVGWDSLYNFGIGDLNSDQDMAATLLAISRLTKAGKPQRCPVVLHHALTGRAGASRAVGYDRGSYGRNSKVLHSWARGQINVAPGSPDANDLLVLTCGKASNGKEFAPFAARLNSATMIYEPAPDFDLAAWQGEVSGKLDRAPAMTPARVRELCKPLMTKAELAKAIMQDCGCYRSSAYRYIKRAEGKTVRLNKTNDTYSAI
jgi:hypothetical protein